MTKKSTQDFLSKEQIDSLFNLAPGDLTRLLNEGGYIIGTNEFTSVQCLGMNCCSAVRYSTVRVNPAGKEIQEKVSVKWYHNQLIADYC